MLWEAEKQKTKLFQALFRFFRKFECHRYHFNGFLFKLHQLFEVVGNGCAQHKLVGCFNSSGPDSAHAGEVDERAEHRLYGAASQLLHAFGIIALQALVHFIVVRFVDAIVYLFVFACFAYALFFQRTILTIGLTAAVGFLGII